MNDKRSLWWLSEVVTYSPETFIDEESIKSVDGPFDHDRLAYSSAFCVYGALHPAAKLQNTFHKY